MFFRRVSLATTQKIELIDITDTVKETVTTANVSAGLCLVATLHTTASIVVNELEIGLLHDIQRMLGEFMCVADSEHDKKHTPENANAQAHILAMLLGHEALFPIQGNRLVLGTWQRILFLELDGPRPRDHDGFEDYPGREYTISIFSG